MTNKDRTIVGEGTINHYWSLCFADEKMRTRIGIKYISQMRMEHPYWYLWFGDLPGAFKLEMVSCCEVFDWDWHAYFRVKYFPHPQENTFQGLSILEQVCRMSDVFNTRPAQWEGEESGCVCHGGIHHHGVRFEELMDGTGAPDLQRAAEIPDDFFLAGQMELFHRNGQRSQLIWESQDHWRVKMTENYYIPDQHGSTLKILRKGDIDRDFPGWMLTDFVARRFGIGWQEHHGFGSLDETTEEQVGLDFTSDGRTLQANCGGGIRRLLTRRLMRN